MNDHRDWRIYNEMLERRGDLTLFVDPAVLRQDTDLKAQNKGKKGRPYQYSSGLIFAAFAIKQIVRFPYRQTRRLLKSLMDKVTNSVVPNFRTIWYRVSRMKVSDIDFRIRPLKPGEKIELTLDSSGIKKVNDGEYRTFMYGKRKEWLRLHIGINGATIEILTEEITKTDVGDNRMYNELVEPVEDNVSVLRTDGAYDSGKNFERAKKKGYQCNIPVHINASTKCHSRARREAIREQLGFRKGRGNYRLFRTSMEHRLQMQKDWRKRTHHGKRWMVETAFSRFKGMFGESVFSKSLGMMRKELLMRTYIYNLTLQG